MKRIEIARIDDRLIHGQVVTAWIKVFPVDKIIIVDDLLTKNNLMMRIYRAAAPTNVSVEIFTIAETLNYFKDNESNEKLMLLVKSPIVFEELIKSDIKIDEIILGGMGLGKNRKRINKNIAMSNEEIESIKSILNTGVKITYKMVPSSIIDDVSTWF